MMFRRLVALVVLAIYVFTWLIAVNGASGLIPILVVPVVLIFFVGGGNWLSGFMGLPTRSQKFKNRDQ